MQKYILIAALGSLLLSCGNKKVNVQDIFEDDQTRWGRNAEKIVLEQKEERPAEATEQVKPTYKEWKFWHPKDEFGDVNNSIGIITMYLDAYSPIYEEEKDRISIDYFFCKENGRDCFVFSSTQNDSYSEILIKMQDGSQFVFHGDNIGGNLYGAVQFTEFDDIKKIADILNEGNFKLKVGGRVTDVTKETKGFRESVEKHFKGEDIEILHPLTTKE